MPVFLHNGRLHVFCHVPKAAGTMIEAVLREEFGQLAFLDQNHFRDERIIWSATSPQHISAADFHRLIPAEMIASSFAVVRHPISRLISAYHFAQRRFQYETKLDEWFCRYVEGYSVMPNAFDNHLRPQHELIISGAKVFRLEDELEACFNFLEERYGVHRPEIIPHANTAKRSSSTAQRTMEIEPKTLALAKEFYAADAEIFGYDMEQTDTRYRLRVIPESRIKSSMKRAIYSAAHKIRMQSRTSGAGKKLLFFSDSRYWRT